MWLGSTPNRLRYKMWTNHAAVSKRVSIIGFRWRAARTISHSRPAVWKPSVTPLVAFRPQMLLLQKLIKLTLLA